VCEKGLKCVEQNGKCIFDSGESWGWGWGRKFGLKGWWVQRVLANKCVQSGTISVLRRIRWWRMG
jgi:hypothetical protein